MLLVGIGVGGFAGFSYEFAFAVIEVQWAYLGADQGWMEFVAGGFGIRIGQMVLESLFFRAWDGVLDWLWFLRFQDFRFLWWFLILQVKVLILSAIWKLLKVLTDLIWFDRLAESALKPLARLLTLPEIALANPPITSLLRRLLVSKLGLFDQIGVKANPSITIGPGPKITGTKDRNSRLSTILWQTCIIQSSLCFSI